MTADALVALVPGARGLDARAGQERRAARRPSADRVLDRRGARRAGLFADRARVDRQRGDRGRRPPLRRRGPRPAAGGARQRDARPTSSGCGTSLGRPRRGSCSRSCARPARSARPRRSARAWPRCTPCPAPTRCARCGPVREHPGKMWRHRRRADGRRCCAQPPGRGADALAPVRRRSSPCSSRTPRWRSPGRGSSPSGEIAGQRVVPFLTEGLEGFSIDYPDDLELAERHGRARSPRCRRRMPDGSRHRSPPARRSRWPTSRPPSSTRIRALERPGHARRGVRRRLPDQRAVHRSWRPARATSARPSACSTSSPGCTSTVLARRRRRASPPRATTRPPSTPCWPGMGKLDFALLHRLRRLGRAARATPTSHAVAGRAHEHRLARHGRLEGQGLRARRPAATAAAGACSSSPATASCRRASSGSRSARPRTRASARSRSIVDHNKIQSDTWVERVTDLGDLEAKVRGVRLGRRRAATATTWPRSSSTLAALLDASPTGRSCSIADTVKGAGVACSSRTRWSTAAPRCTRTTPARRTPTSTTRAIGRAARPGCASGSGREPELEPAQAPPRARAAATPQKLVDAYGAALAERGRARAAARRAGRRPRPRHAA